MTAGDWGVSDIAWHPDGRTIAFAADRGPEPDLHPRTTIWAVDVDARKGAGGEPREVMAPGGWANHPAWSPDGRWLAAIGVLEPEPLDDVSPGILVGPADGKRPPHELDPKLDRVIGNWTDTDLNGWMVSGRHGPDWVDERRARRDRLGSRPLAPARLHDRSRRPAARGSSAGRRRAT